MTGSSCDVVVIGGGITGAATAVHLAAAGIRSVSVLDAGPPGSGSTPASAGIVGMTAAEHAAEADAGCEVAETYAAMQRYSIDYYANLAGIKDIGFRLGGTLWLSLTEHALAEQRDLLSEHVLLPAAKELSASDVGELWSDIRTDSIVGGMYDPETAQVDAGQANRALVEAGRLAGIEFRWAAQVAQILHDGHQATGVMLTSGEVVRAGTIVVSVGAWTNALLEPLGLRLELSTKLDTRVTIPDVEIAADLPTVIVPEVGDLRLREGGGGLSYANAWGMARWEPRPAPIRPDLGELAIEMHERVQPTLRNLFPHLGDHGWRWIQGVPCFTPDGRMYAGYLPGLEGVVVATGCNGHAMRFAPAVGRAIAALIAGDDVHQVLGPFSPERGVVEF